MVRCTGVYNILEEKKVVGIMCMKIPKPTCKILLFTEITSPMVSTPLMGEASRGQGYVKTMHAGN